MLTQPIVVGIFGAVCYDAVGILNTAIIPKKRCRIHRRRRNAQNRKRLLNEGATGWVKSIVRRLR